MKYHVAVSIIALLAAILCAVIMLSPAVAGAEELPPIGVYSRGAVIIDINYLDDLVKVVDGADLIWIFSGVEDYDIGDFVIMEMWEHNTPESIYDDEILWVSYGGFNVYYIDEYR